MVQDVHKTNAALLTKSRALAMNKSLLNLSE